jgi:hypothetical protein
MGERETEREKRTKEERERSRKREREANDVQRKTNIHSANLRSMQSLTINDAYLIGTFLKQPYLT